MQQKISIEKTANPNILKYVIQDFIFPEAKEYSEMSQTVDFPLAQQLLQFPFVETLLTSADFIAIQKTENVEWETVQDALQEVIEKGIATWQNEKPKYRPIEVYIEATPNPQVIKLVTNALLYEGIAEAFKGEENRHFPLAQYLLQLKYVQAIFVQDNYISLTKTEEADWQDHTFEIRDLVATYLREGKPILEAVFQPTQRTQEAIPTKEFSSLEKEIQNILEEYVKPAVAGDGGNIDLVEYDPTTKTAKMLLQGACSGCPSSTITLKNGIESILKQMLPNQIEEVIAINE